MDPFSNPLHAADDGDLAEQATELGPDPAGLEEYPHVAEIDPDPLPSDRPA